MASTAESQKSGRLNGLSFSSTVSSKLDRPAAGSNRLGSPQRPSPAISPRSGIPNPIDHEAVESSADENTAIVTGAQQTYGAAEERQSHGQEQDANVRHKSTQGGTQRRSINKKRPSSRPNQDQAGQVQRPVQEKEGWWARLLDKYGSVELENKGSVARDHLALERTFLAWLRTSLSFASIGVAITQLFRLNSALSDSSGGSSASSNRPVFDEAIADAGLPLSPRGVSSADTHRLRQIGKPLGATFLGISILILVLGFHRYFESQHYVIRGKFPASRGSIVLVTFVAAALIIASLVIVVTVAPSAFKT